MNLPLARVYISSEMENKLKLQTKNQFFPLSNEKKNIRAKKKTFQQLLEGFHRNWKEFRFEKFQRK